MKTRFRKALSVLLTFAITLSAVVCMFSNVSAAEAIYFVSSSGLDTNNGTTETTAVTSIAKAIELANLTYRAGDTVTIRVEGEQVDLGTLPEYSFDLTVEGVEETQTVIYSPVNNPVVAKNTTGTTYYKNVKFKSANTYPSFSLDCSKNVVLDSTVANISGNNYLALGTYNDGGAAKIIAGQNIVLNNIIGTLYLGNSGWQNRTYTEDVNVTIAGGGSTSICFKGLNGGAIKFQKNLNINIKKANSITFKNGSGTFGGAVQVINSTSSSVNSLYTTLDGIECEKYVINNITGKADIIEFTETKGKFKVNTTLAKYEVIATDKDGNVVKVGEDGYLILTTPGDYELSLYRPAQTPIYYVSANGSDTAEGDKSNPLQTVAGAINAALEAEMISGDIVTVKLLGNEIIQWCDSQTTPTHNFDLVVESFDKNNYSTVNIKQATYLGGTTEIKYGIYQVIDQYPQLRINNKNFTIGDGANVQCNYYTFGDNSTQNNIAGQKVVFKNDIGSTYIYLSNILHSNGKRYTDDLEVVIDNPYAAPVLQIGGQKGKVYYDANLNLNVKQASSISFGLISPATNECNGAIQLISNSKTFVDSDGIEFLKTTCNPTKGFYHIINDSEFKDLLSFTKIEGKYAVDTDKYTVTAVSEKGIIEAKDGYLVLNGAGTYTVTAVQKMFEPDNTIYEKLDGTTIDLSQNNKIAIDNAESVATIDFGDLEYQDVEINVLNASKIEFVGNPVINGKLYVAVNKSTIIEGKDVIDNITANGGKWYVINNSGSDIKFGKVKGEILYTASSKELEAVSGDTVIAPRFQNFLLNEGEYEIRIKEKSEDQFADYIDYRGNGLANTYAKIKNNKKLNVVYLGGSVTNGSGASSSNVTSWRGLVGQWLKNTYPNAEINNMNSAIGATGTSLGIYRLERHVLAKKPDLLFVEFSINDYLDLHHVSSDSYEIAKKQFETIIRTVRQKLPECDIVVLHTIDKATTPQARKGIFFTEAQAHNDVAKAYDIPTIDIGGALVNSLPEDWESVWSEIMTDTVHPTDKGYTYYFNVIKEYLSNVLLYSKHTGEVQNHTLPKMLSDKLVDGDVKFYDANAQLLEKSTALGGSGFEYSLGGKYQAYDYGCIESVANHDSEFVFEFIGTEVALVDTDSNQSGYNVKVDDGEYTFVKKSGMTKPRVLVKNLESGKHTIHIKPHSDNETVSIKLISLYTRDDSKATHEHVFGEYVLNNNATCKSDGTKTAKCKHCDATDTLTAEGTMLKHKFTNYVPNNDATCIQKGTKTAVCDNGCGQKDTCVDEASILKHNYDETTGVCLYCGKTICAVMGNHEYEGATCTKNGKCALCGDMNGPKLAHDFKSATCTAPKTCKTCGYKSGKALGHDYEDKVTKATTSKNGKTYEQCERCDKVTNEKTIYKIKTIKLKATKFTFNGKKKAPAIVVKDYKGNTINSKYYTITGTKSATSVGKYKMKITFKTKYSGSKTLSYEIKKPTVKKSSVSKLTALKKSLKVSIKKASSVSGYEIEYSTSKKFKSSKKKTTIKTSYTIKSLKAKTTYYVRVRSYKAVGGKKFYSAWSSVKSKKTK